MVLNLTIVIPTYNRHNALSAAINFWTAVGLQIIVVDGLPCAGQHCICSAQSSTVVYAHIESNFYRRIFLGVSMVTTPYVLVVPDDEIWDLSFLVEAVKFLESNPTVSYVFGQVENFAIEDGNLVLSPGYPNASRFSGHVDRSWSRVLKRAWNYHPASLFSIAKSSDYARCMKLASSIPWRIDGFEELTFELLMARNYRGVYLKEIGWYRNIHNPPNVSPDGGSQIRGVSHGSFKFWWKNNRFRRSKFGFVANLFLPPDAHIVRRLLWKVLLWKTLYIYYLRHYGFLARMNHVLFRFRLRKTDSKKYTRAVTWKDFSDAGTYSVLRELCS
jgi:glycosyltransferase domain-containing protein